MSHAGRSLGAVVLLLAGSSLGGGGCGADGAPSDLSVGADLGSPADLGAPADLTPPCTPDSPLDWDGGLPTLLSETGLYTDVAAQAIAPGVRAYRPAHELWADGADKRRWLRLPACSQIDTSDMDHWQVPVGTRVWKEFSVGGALVETRLITRVGAGEGEFLYGAYQWNPGGTEATLVPAGVSDANGTAHDIPSADDCKMCHQYLPERLLGLGAVQLSHLLVGSLSVGSLNAAGLLSVPAPTDYQIPEDASGKARAALGYLHANCGHCHNPTGVAFPKAFSLRLELAQTAVETTSAYLTAYKVPIDNVVSDMNVTHRLAPMAPGASCIAYRMGQRGGFEQMPPLATEQVDTAGLQAVTDWINVLQP